MNVNQNPIPVETPVKASRDIKHEIASVHQFPKQAMIEPAQDIDVGMALLALSEGNAQKRAVTVRLIGDLAFMKKIKIPETVEPLCKVLTTDEDPNVREEAAWALWKLGDLRAKEPLLHALANDNSVGVKEKSARALGLLGVSEASQLMVALLSVGRQVHSRLRAALATALGFLGDERAWRVLLRAAEDAEPTVRYEAIKSLRRYLYGPTPDVVRKILDKLLKSVDFRHERISQIRKSAVDALKLCDDPRIPQMLSKVAVRDVDPEIRKMAVESFVYFHNKMTEQALIMALEDSNWPVKKAAGRMLAELISRFGAYNLPKVREALSRMERVFPSGSREWRLAANAFVNL